MRRQHILLGALAWVTAGAAGAQDAAPAPAPVNITVDAHWLPFLGCWTTSSGGRSGPVTCLLSTSDARRIEVATVRGDSAVVQETFDLTGTPVRFTRDGCTGTNVTGWTMDEHSFHVRTELTCGDSAKQVSTSLFTMRTPESFVRAQSMAVRTTTAVRVVEFRDMADPSTLPAAVLQRVPATTSPVVQQARSAALAQLSASDVRDALMTLDHALVEAWIASHGQPVQFTGKDLRAMSQANVPERVLDMMIAVSNPAEFTLNAAGEPVKRSEMERRTPAQRYADRYAPIYTMGSFDCYSGGMYVLMSCASPRYAMNDCYSGYLGSFYPGMYGSLYSPLGWSRGAWNSGYCNSLYNNYRQVVVYPNNWVNGGTPSTQPPTGVQPGQVIRGRGYSQGSSSGGSRGPAQPVDRAVTQTAGTSTRTATAGNGGYSSGSSSSGSSAPASSSAGGGGQRTAKPRP